MSTKIKNIFNFSFLKQNKKSSTDSSGRAELDAAPSSDSVKKSKQGHFERKSKQANKERPAPEEEEERSHDTSDYEDDDSSRKENFETHSDKKSKENINFENLNAAKGNVFNITGTGFHFGNNYTIQNQHNYGFPVAPQEKNKEKKSASVKALLKCADALDPSYTDFISKHFGKQWKKIGLALKLTSSELDEIKEKFESSKERGYEMLKLWQQKQNPQTATVGLVCKLLWDSNIRNAKEAVELTSVYFQDLN